MAAGHVAMAFDLLLASAEQAQAAADHSARTAALAYAATIADRFAEDFPEKVPHDRLRQLIEEAARSCPGPATRYAPPTWQPPAPGPRSRRRLSRIRPWPTTPSRPPGRPTTRS